MLTFDQIKSLYSSGEIQKFPKYILVEYLQYEILDSIFRQRESGALSFMGGTAIRICYGGTRFSEDLDFDNFKLSFDEFSEMLDNTVKDMQLKGFTIEFRMVEKGAYHCYIKFPEILRASNLAVHGEEKILVRIDTVQKEQAFEPRIFTLNRFDIFRDIKINPPDIILSQKILTVLQRKRPKGRDFYDVSYLFGIARPNMDYLKKTIGVDGATLKKLLLERCNEVDLKGMARDVRPFLINPDKSRRVEQFRRFVEENF